MLIDTSISLFQKKNHQFFLVILSSFLLVDMDVGNHTILTEFILLGLSTDPQWQLILFGVFLTVYLVTLSGNMTLVILIHIDSHLHTPMFFFFFFFPLEICLSWISGTPLRTLPESWLLVFQKTSAFPWLNVEPSYSFLVLWPTLSAIS